MKTFEKIVLITTPEYLDYFEKFISSKVAVIWATPGYLNSIVSAIMYWKKFESGKILWLTHTEMFKIDQPEISDLCTTCIKPLEIHVPPSTQRLTYYRYAVKMQSSFVDLIMKVNAFLDADSSFVVLPPFPPLFLPLEESDHDLYHKINQSKKKYYYTTPSALIKFKSLYTELNKQMILFFLAELKKNNISSESITEYLRISESWNSYVYVETHAYKIHFEEYNNAKYNLWFEHISKFISDSLKPLSGEFLCEESTNKKNKVLKEPINPEYYDHIVIICFCKMHAQLVPRDKNISVIVVKSALNWCEEREKFYLFARVYKAVLFIIIGSVNLLGKEYPDHFCNSVKCTNPFICMKLGVDSNDKVAKRGTEKYKLFIGNIRKYFEKLSTSFMLTPILPLKLTPKPLITKSSHEHFHKVITDANAYFSIGEISRWSSLANVFQKCYYNQMLQECHTLYEIKTFFNVLKEIKYTSKPISRVELLESTIILDADYDEDELKLFLNKFVAISCSFIEHERKNPQFSAPQTVNDASENNSTLTSAVLLRQEVRDLPIVNREIAMQEKNSTNEKKKVQHFASADITDFLQRVRKQNVDSGTPQLIPKFQKKDNTCHLKILLRSDFAETVTGNIEKLQEETNSKVNISKEFEYFPGTHKRVCSIAGTTHAVLKALFSIMDFTERSPFIVGYEVQVEFVVPISTANIINDPRQINMRQVMMESKACLRMCKKKKNHLTETLFMVRSIGEEFVRAAFSLIVEYVILDPENGTGINVIYPNVSYLAPEQRKLLSSVKKIMDLPTHLLVLNKSKENKICDLKILLENLECEALIGDKGETLEKLKTYSNSTVTISKELEYFAGTTEFTCHIAGAAKAVLKALLFFIDIKKGNAPFGSEVKMVFVLPHSTAKLLIGNEEEKLQQIRTQSKVYMRMYNKKDYPSSTEACFVVRSFDIEFIRTAFVLIIDCITSNSGNNACHSLSNPNAKLPETAKIDRYANISSIAEGQDDCWSNQNYRYQMNENYVSCAGVSSQYNYEYPIAGGYDSNFAENEHPVLFSQKIDEYSSHSQYNYEYPIAGGYDSNFAENKHPVLFSQKIDEYPSHEVSEYSFRYVSNEHKESTQLANSFSRQDGKDYESGSQIAGEYSAGGNQMSSRLPSRDSGYECHLSKDSRQRYSHRSRSPSRYNYKSKSRSRGSQSQRSRSVSSKRRLSAYSSRKRSHSRTKSTENQSLSLLKRSHEDSRSINRNYRKGRSFSRSLSKTRNYRRRRRSSSRALSKTRNYRRSFSRSLSKTRNYRRRRRSSSRSRSRTRSLSDSRGREFQSRCKKNSPKISDKSSHHNIKTDSEFSVIGALNLLETVCNKYGILSEIIKPFITIIKSELEVDKCKALRLTKDDNNLLELIVSKLISRIASAPSEEIEMLSKAVDWTNDLIEQARKAENSESDINIRAIAYSRSRSRSSSKRSSDSQDRKRHSKYKRKTPKAADKSDHFDDVKVGDEFSLIGALNLLEKACDNYKELRKIIKRFTAIIRSELEVDRSKALRLIKGESILLEMIVNKLKSRLLSAPLEEIGMLSKTIEWTNDLIEHARKAENSESDINIRAIAYSRSRSRSNSKRSSHSQGRKRHSRDGGKTPSKHMDKSDHFDNVKVGDDFSVSGAIYLLERVCDKCGTLGEWVKTFTTSLKSEVDDRSKTSKIIEDENNIHFLGMIINKLKSCTVSASVEESEMISKAAEWTAHLIEYIENFKKPEIKVDLKAIAEASINKTPDSIIDFIKMAFLYSGISNPTDEDISEAFVKVSELQFKMTINDKS